MAEDTFTREMVVEYVQPSPRKWENPKGADLFFVSVNFSDGTEGSVGVVEGKVDEAIASLNALKGVPTAFELKAGKEFNGVPQYRMYGWPGKPDALGGSGGGGGGRGGGGMSHSQAGYLAAASVLAGRYNQAVALEVIAVDVVKLGEMLTQALFDRKPPTESTQPQAATPTDTLTLAQLKALKELIPGQGKTIEQVCSELGIKALTELSEKDAADLLELWQA